MSDLVKRILSVIIVSPLLVFCVLYGSKFFCFLLIAIWVICCSEIVWTLRQKIQIRYRFLYAVPAIIYVSIGTYSLFYLYLQNFSFFIFAVFLTWINDSVAYLIGRRFGQNALIAISPKKTQEGFISGLIACMVWGVFFYLKTTFFHSLIQALSISAILSIVAVIGDLIESAFKRAIHAKDLGFILPGHGGVCDRMDSLFLVSPACLAFLFWVL